MIRSVAVAAVRAGRAPALAFSRRSSFDIAHQVVLGGQTIQRATVVVPLAEKLESGELQFSCAAFASVIAAAFGALSHSPAQCADNNSGKKRVAGTLEGFVRSKPKLDDLDRAAMFAPWHHCFHCESATTASAACKRRRGWVCCHNGRRVCFRHEHVRYLNVRGLLFIERPHLRLRPLHQCSSVTLIRLRSQVIALRSSQPILSFSVSASATRMLILLLYRSVRTQQQ